MGKIEERLELARNELLDLSFRNPLINYKLRAMSGLEFPSLNASDVFDYLVNEGKACYFTTEITNNPSRLGSAIDPNELKNRLLKTYRSGKLYVEEKGANILFLALGFLKWKENFTENIYRSPLILVPVEMKRQENSDRFSIVYSGEEIRVNVSLITKMKNEYNINIDYESEDEIHGINEYFRQVTDAIKEKTDWEVEATKGAFDFFSYAKFLMYKDLDITKWVDEKGNLDNDVLERLFVTGFDDKLSKKIDIDKALDPQKIMNVVDCDSSQAQVIYDIKRGNNLVIQGPPGTGKSQTITNIIASSVASGKSILFVSEKKAALDVVKRRLEHVGLGDLVLELHSQKTNKTDVLKSIQNTLSLGDVKTTDDTKLDNRYEEVKTELSSYKNEVNSSLENGELSLTDVYGNALAIEARENEDNVHFPRLDFKDLDKWTYKDYEKRLDIVKEFSSLVQQLGKIEKHPLYGVTRKELAPYEQVVLKEKVNDLEDALTDMVSSINSMATILNTKVFTLLGSISLLNAIDYEEKYKDLDVINTRTTYYVESKEELKKILDDASEFKRLSKDYNLDVVLKDLDNFDCLCLSYYNLPYEGRLKAKDLRDSLAKYLPNQEFQATALNELSNVVTKYKELDKYTDLFKNLFKDQFTGWFDTDFRRLKGFLSTLDDFYKDILNGNILPSVMDVIQDKDERERLHELKENFDEKKQEFISKMKDFLTFSKFDIYKKFETPDFYLVMDFVDLKKIVSQWKNNIDSVIEVVRYNSLKQGMKDLGMEELFRYFKETGKADYLADILSLEYFQKLIKETYATYPSLAGVKAYRMGRDIDLFKDLDVKMMIENIKTILKKHFDNMPKINDNTKEMAIIRREIQKKRNQMPIRRILSKTGAVVQKIKPVFMMSPISVASFLPPKEVKFDLVVFDEASQVRPVEAFGALLRAKQIVVVGDSKQLPPTNFFDTMTSKFTDMNDEDYDASNMESILSLLLAKNIPQRTLSWHYRSRNQSLITLSNNEFYDHQLNVFPSVNDKDPNQGLIFKYIPNSIYARGSSRTNKIEAKEVIKEVFEHALNHPEMSLGVASFSLSQQEELYREFDRQMKNCHDQRIKDFFAKHPDEPFFIKNLENVQGDERDAIFISIGYGYDENHNITMDFGPLNKDGGERRLNVLITRAKVKCEVFSNLTSNDINLAKTSAKGVVALKRFLDYAQNRTIYRSRSDETAPDRFTDYLYQRLSDYGYDVDRSIGKDVGIDLAIYDKNLKRYTVGIECDGGKYKTMESSTDRERIRRNVLKSLGWRLYHVWTPEFYRNPKNEFEKLLDYIAEDKEEASVKGSPEITIERKKSQEWMESEKVLPYEVYQGPKRRSLLLSDKEGLTNIIDKIAKVESPLHIMVLKKRLMYLTELSKLTDEQSDFIEKTILADPTLDYRDDFITRKDQSEFPVRNRENIDKSLKKADYVADQELISAIMLSLERGDATNAEEAAKAACLYLGFNKNPNIVARVVELVKKLIEANKITLEDNVLYIKD